MSDFYARLQRAMGASPPKGVQLAPKIEPKMMANASKWAPFGQEQPMLLIDNTVFGSGKAGVLVTSHALYFDDPKTRIDLADIVEPPVYPEGVTKQGTIRTRRGDLQLPLILGGDEAEIVKRVLLEIVSINRGTSSAQIPPVAGPIGLLALQHLQHKDVHLAPDLPREKMKAAAANFTDWLDHANGEQPVAYLDETALGKGDEGILLTDRRLLAFTESGGKHVMIPYGAIANVSAAKGFLDKKLKIDAGQFSAEIPLITCGDAVEPLVLFLRGLMQLPPNDRWVPAPTFATADELLQSLGAPDLRIPIMLRYVSAMTKNGAMQDAMAADLVARIRMLHMTLAYGRGMAQGWRVSPLHGGDFHFMLSTVFGDPVNTSSTQSPPDPYRGVPSRVEHAFDFALGRRSSVAGAAASTAVGLAMLAVVGVGWVSTPKRTIQGVRVMMTELPSATGFAALGMQGGRVAPLADIEPEVLDWLLDALDDIEALIIFYRAAFGWGIPPQQLFQWGTELPARVSQVLGPTDLSPFDRTV